jgi:hypothetical protein
MCNISVSDTNKTRPLLNGCDGCFIFNTFPVLCTQSFVVCILNILAKNRFHDVFYKACIMSSSIQSNLFVVSPVPVFGCEYQHQVLPVHISITLLID